jgi:ferrochelatase
MSRLAVVLFNLGGPDRPEAVAPFLFNLFYDPAIIALPRPLRWLLAILLAARRAPKAAAIYGKLGGGSPLLSLTREQAGALEARLGPGAKVFIAMRYWQPLSDAAAAEVKAFAPERIVLLPLYPQYSTTTTESSLKDWRRAAAAAGLGAPTVAVCCYPTEAGFVAAHARLIRAGLAQAAPAGKPRVLFSAHGLPKKVIARGDPYQWQVEQTAAAIVKALGVPGLDSVVCYQSRVGPLEWLGPSTEEEIARAGADRVPVVVVPVAFVSEHSETLVELDIDYRARAEALGVPAYVRVPALGVAPEFIDGLARLVQDAARAPAGTCLAFGGRRCPRDFARCAGVPA